MHYTQINLLPWRKVKRAESIKQWAICSVVSVVVAICLLMYFKYVANQWVAAQKIDNLRIHQEIEKYNGAVAQINRLHELQTNLLNQITAIDNIERTSLGAVRLLSELFDVVPRKIYLTQLKRRGQTLSVYGVASSSRHLSAMMRALTRHPCVLKMSMPHMKRDTVNRGHAQVFYFNLLLKRC